MQKIREWMEPNPDGAKELRRQNRSYVFFREVKLSDKDEAVGAQGVPLTPGRSIAVDKSLHVYGTPFFISGELPIEFGAVEDAVPPADDRAGHGLGHRRPRARRSLFRRGSRCRQGRGPAQEQHALCHAGAEEPRSRGARQQAAGARCAAVGEDRKTFSANDRRRTEKETAPRTPPAGTQSRPQPSRPDRPSRCKPRAAPAAANRCRCRMRGRRARRLPTRSTPSPPLSPPMKRPPSSRSPTCRPPRRKRGLSEEERALWESVAKQVKPLRKKPRVAKPRSLRRRPRKRSRRNR